MRGNFIFASSIDEGHCRMTAAAGNALRVEKKSAKITWSICFHSDATKVPRNANESSITKVGRVQRILHMTADRGQSFGATAAMLPQRQGQRHCHGQQGTTRAGKNACSKQTIEIWWSGDPPRHSFILLWYQTTSSTCLHVPNGS